MIRKVNKHDLISYGTKTQSVDEWALDYGILPSLIIQRLRLGWSEFHAITRPMELKSKSYRLDKRGVGSNSEENTGTGGGSFAHDLLELDFSTKEQK